MALNLDEIHYEFAWSVTLMVFNKKRKIIFHNHCMKVYAKNSDDAINDAKWLLPKHL